mgnify:CR=1 FL=1
MEFIINHIKRYLELMARYLLICILFLAGCNNKNPQNESNSSQEESFSSASETESQESFSSESESISESSIEEEEETPRRRHGLFRKKKDEQANENNEELDMKVPHNNRLKYERDSSEGEPIVKKLDDLTIDSSSVVSIEDNLQDKNDGE